MMTLWDAYRLANRRRAAVDIDLADGHGLGNGRTERALRVSPHRRNGMIAVQQGLTADWDFVASEDAKEILVER